MKSNKLNIEELAQLFDLPSWDALEEMNLDYFAAGLDWNNEDAEEEMLKIEDERRAELYTKWHTAIERTAAKLLGEHGLKLEAVKPRKGAMPYEYRVIPQVSWNDAARQVMETINGVGTFYYRNLREFLAAGPWTAREATLSHLHWIKRYPDVYGTATADRMYHAHMS